MVKDNLTLEEQINRAKDGRTQSWIVKKMIQNDCHISDVTFSRKKKNSGIKFTEKELSVLSEILGAKLVNDK